MNTRNNRLSVRVLAGVTIATIVLELPVLAVPQPAPMLMAQVACIVSKTTSVYRTANPSDPEVLPNRFLIKGDAVALREPLPNVSPARVQISKQNGFVDLAALINCGKPTPPSPKTTACRKVRNTVSSMEVRRDHSYGANLIAAVGAGQPVYVTQTGGVTTSRKDADGEAWMEVDLQKTFGEKFQISSGFGWMLNTAPDDPRGPLVTCN